MPNQIDANGLQTKTQAELVAQFQAAFKAIYGNDIVLSSDSPDGQMMMIFIQSVLDNSDLLTQIYNTFDPDNAIGVVLDQRVAINGIQRQAGTYTVTNVSISVDRSLNLNGLDQTAYPPYTVADSAGTQWQLITSVALTAGTHALAFRAANPGATLTVPNTITQPVTIVLGVTGINNPTTYTTLGINEESDAALKIRRQKSVSLSSQGYLAGLLAALENINGITAAYVYENTTGITDANGVPGHSIWVIVAGTAAAADIASAIYRKRNAGCGMYGTQEYSIAQPDGTLFTIVWDYVTPKDLFIQFTATSLNGTDVVNYAAIRSGLVTSFAPGVAEQVNINDLATAVQAIDNNCLVTNAGFSTSSTAITSSTLTPATKDLQFAVTSAKIIILPILVTPTSATVVHGASQTFTSYGGYGTYTYSFQTNNSSGSIGSVTGVYTAGSVSSVVDVIKVVDQLSHSTFVSVSVT